MTAREQFIRAACGLHYAGTRHNALTNRNAFTADAIYSYWYWRMRHVGTNAAAAKRVATMERYRYISGEMPQSILSHDLEAARLYGGIDAPIKL